MPFTRTNYTRCVTARQFSAIQDRFENACRFWRQSSDPDFFFCPHNDARAQPIEPDKAFHKRDLIDAHPQKEPRKFGQRLLAEVAATIKIVPPGSIGIGETPFVSFDIARQSAGNRPDASRIQNLQEHGVRHQTRNAPVAVKKRVNPQKAVMRCRRTKNRVRPFQVTVDFLEATQETRQRAGTDSDVLPTFISPRRNSPGTTRTRSFASGSSTHGRSSGSSSPKRRWISRMPSVVAARPFNPPPSIHFWTVICAFASSCRSRFRGSLL